MEIPGHQAALAILDLARVGDDTFEPLRTEVLCKQHKFAVAGNLAPVENGNARRFAVARPLLVSINQGVQDAVTRWQGAHLVLA